MNKTVAKFHIVTIAFLITGNLIGAGILALPINTGLSGLIPSLLSMIVIGTAMFFSAVVLSHQAIKERGATFNYPSLYHKYLGVTGKWIAIAANMLILYGLLTAYLAGAASIISNILDIKIPGFFIVIAFCVIMTTINVAGLGIVRKYNFFLMLLLGVSFIVIVLLCFKYIDTSRFAYKDWKFAITAVPIIVTAFHFHNIIPNVCKALDWDFKMVCKTMFIGMFLSFVMCAVWVWVSLGNLPLTGGNTSLLHAFQENLPATVPLAAKLHSPFFIISSLVFSLLAIMTSYLANGTGLMSFTEDLLHNHLNLKKNRMLLISVTFLPPLIIAMTYPNIFLKAINIVGGFGIIVLFGILPSIIALMTYRTPWKRVLSMIMLIFFSVFFILEIAQVTGLMTIRPASEHMTRASKMHKHLSHRTLQPHGE